MTVSQSGSSTSKSILDLFRQSKTALQSIQTDVQSGNLAAAQTDIQTFQQAEAALQASAANSFAGAPSATNPYRTMVKTDLTALSGAINSGSLTGAKAALLKFQLDSKSGVTSPTGATPVTPALASEATGGQVGGGFLGNLKTLLSSVSSGDQSGAQLAASALNKDLEKLTSGAAAAGQPLSQQQSKFVGDLQSLIAAAQTGSTTQAQTAAQTLATDLRSALSSGGVSGAGHHHHHHADAKDTGKDTGSSNSPVAAATDPTAAPTTAQASATVPVSSSTSSLFGDGNTSVFQTAQSALNLLMLFSGTSVAGSAVTAGVSKVLSKLGTSAV